MDQITLQDYRCFHGEQTARLAPLTLLVGENSTGKTSFMAMLRALWEVAYGSAVPDFKEQPYDLGSFEEIAHHPGAGAKRDRVQCRVPPETAARRRRHFVRRDFRQARHSPGPNSSAACQ